MRGGGEGRGEVGTDGNGEGAEREKRQGKWREGSTWIFVQRPRSSYSYATECSRVFQSCVFRFRVFTRPVGAYRSHVTKAVARPGGLLSLASRETLMTTAGDNSAINADAFWRN